MISSSPPNLAPSPFSAMPAEDVSSELKTISELGRSLVMTVHPKKVAVKVAETVTQALDSSFCAFVAELKNVGLISCVYSPAGDVPEDFLDRQKFEKWVSFLPPQIGFTQTDRDDFFVHGSEHQCEYVSPLHIDGSIHGVIVVGFADRRTLSDRGSRLLEAITQMAAMSINLSDHYGVALHESINEAKEEHRKFTESVLDALPVSLYVVDRDYKIVTWNRHREIGEQGLPRDMVIGRDVFDVLERYPKNALQAEFERAFRTGVIERIEQQTTADDGTTRHWMVSKVPMRSEENGEITHVITVGEDVTMRVEAIQAVNRAEKLAAVGRLAAGVVHEINNPLATIAACAEALEQRVDEGAFEVSEAADDLAEYLGLIKSEAFRCKSITTDLLDFSRVRAGERTSADAGDIVRSAANLISHQKRGNGITQVVEIQHDLPRVSVDPGQIQQAVIALATNGIDAMPHGGTLSFRVFSGNNRLVIEVEDTGTGIPPGDMSKVFEPFFTTKEVGKGTGLGLSVCYGIVTEHGGRLSVRSTEGKGTTFSILLPVCS